MYTQERVVQPVRGDTQKKTEKNQKQIYFDTQIHMLKYYEILPEQYSLLEKIKDKSIDDDQFRSNMTNIMSYNNQTFRKDNDEAEQGMINSSVNVTESGLV